MYFPAIVTFKAWSLMTSFWVSRNVIGCSGVVGRATAVVHLHLSTNGPVAQSSFHYIYCCGGGVSKVKFSLLTRPSTSSAFLRSRLKQNELESDKDRMERRVVFFFCQSENKIIWIFQSGFKLFAPLTVNLDFLSLCWTNSFCSLHFFCCRCDVLHTSTLCS